MFLKPSASNVPFHWNGWQNYADIKQLTFALIKILLHPWAFHMQTRRCMFLSSSFHFQLGSFETRCCQQMSFWWRQRKWEGAGYHQHRNDPPLGAPSKAQPQRRLQPLHYLFNLQMTVSPNAMLPSIKSRGHEYTKGKAEAHCLPQLYLAQLYRLRFFLWASTFCFSLKGTVLRSPRLNQGRSRILDLSSGLQMQVKCGHQMSSFFYIIGAGGQRQQGSVVHPLVSMHSPP